MLEDARVWGRSRVRLNRSVVEFPRMPDLWKAGRSRSINYINAVAKYARHVYAVAPTYVVWAYRDLEHHGEQ